MHALAKTDEYWNNVVQQLKLGTVLTKQKTNGKGFHRRFFLSENENSISYHPSKKLLGKAEIYHIKDIDEIRDGFQAEAFHHLLKRRKIKSRDESRAFSILYDDHRQALHLLASDSQTRDLWVEALRYLTTRHGQKRQGDLIREEKWILDHFHLADKDRSNILSKRECRNLLENSFHVVLPDSVFEHLFERADRSGEGKLNSEEFLRFFHLLTRRQDLYEVMKENTHQGARQSIENISMNREELFHFLRSVQQMKTITDLRQIQSLIDQFEMDPNFRKEGKMSLDGFRSLLLSEEFDLADPYAMKNIYQDMTRPLCDYYISTSHNTYLFYSQLTGDSNPEAYNRVLFSGGRAVELDCYDGDDGQPIVYHAYTLVKPCTFESIIRAIDKNLFKTSPYPVILNIENHCSAPQQKRMANILKSILGDRLITEPLPERDPSLLPSPDDLKYKVLIRSKKLSATSALAKKQLELEDDDDSPADPLSKNIQPELAELFVYLQNVPYKENEIAKRYYSPFHSSSLAEDHFYKISQKTPVDIVYQTSWRLIRTYPDGFRQDSSNQDPVHAWNSGVQLAALNYQNNDLMMALNYGKFLDNGSCGYVLKPQYLIQSTQTHFNPWNPMDPSLDIPVVLTIRIISAQFLSRAEMKSSDIPDPYVAVSVHGLPCDSMKYQTKVIANNGFDPMWNETLTFRVKYPQLALFYVAVYDHDDFSGDDRIASFALPLLMMQQGYRHIHLRAPNNDSTHSTLFVHVNILEENHREILCTRL